MKIAAEFYTENKRGRQQLTSRCRVCYCAKVKAWRDANPDKCRAMRKSQAGQKRQRDPVKRKEYNRRYNKSDRAREARARWAKTDKAKAIQRRSAQRVRWPKLLATTYGITVEEYAWMLHAQDFSCAICRQAFSRDVIPGSDPRSNRERPCVDHNHDTGSVRGLVCGWCNYGILGPLEKAGADKIARALAYLGVPA